MIHLLLEHIEIFTSIEDDLKERIQKISSIKKISKGDFLHKPGRVCDRTYFITKGLLRTYYEKDGKEVTDNFSAEGEWITSIYSFLQNVPDRFHIQAIEDSDLIVIKLEDLEKCFHDFHAMETFGRILMTRYFLSKSEKAISLQFFSAREKYQYFLKTEKHKVNRIPLGMVASYLGITQETLSRVRAERG